MDGIGLDWIGLDGTEFDGMGWARLGWAGLGRDGKGRDGKGRERGGKGMDARIGRRQADWGIDRLQLCLRPVERLDRNAFWLQLDSHELCQHARDFSFCCLFIHALQQYQVIVQALDNHCLL